MIREVETHPELLDNANEMRTTSVKVSKAHLRVQLRQLGDELARATARAKTARGKSIRAIKRHWAAEEAVIRLQRRIDKKRAEIAG